MCDTGWEDRQFNHEWWFRSYGLCKIQCVSDNVENHCCMHLNCGVCMSFFMLYASQIIMYASQLWCNFRKSCMQRLQVAYNFGCRALYNLSWRASVGSHQVLCNIPTFEALLRKYKYLFLERCRKSNNVWLRALMQSDCLYSSLFFEHYNRISLCEWVIELCSVRLIDGVSSHNVFEFYLD